MTRTGRALIVFGLVLAGSLVASALMTKFSPNSSWMAFTGWAVFFVALQLPWIFVKPTTQSGCTSWLSIRKR